MHVILEVNYYGSQPTCHWPACERTKAIKQIVGDHPFCFKEVARAGGVLGFFLGGGGWYECGSEDKDFIYFRTCI